LSLKNINTQGRRVHGEDQTRYFMMSADFNYDFNQDFNHDFLHDGTPPLEDVL